MKVYKLNFLIIRLMVLFTIVCFPALISFFFGADVDYTNILYFIALFVILYLYFNQIKLIISSNFLIRDYVFFKRNINIQDISLVVKRPALFKEDIEVRKKDGSRFLYDIYPFFLVDSDLKGFILELRKVNPEIKTNFEESLK